MRVLGMMSGTSLDGLDLALVDFSGEVLQHDWSIVAATTLPYSVEWKNRLDRAPQLSGVELFQLHVEYGRFLGEQALEFLEGKVCDLIASHGHTAFHCPDRGFSMQLGHGDYLSKTSNLPCAWDFRTRDLVHGGEGAPLAPIGDAVLFPDYTFCVNLGGIVNYSFEYKGKRIGIDLGACNLLLNKLAQQAGKEFDEGGESARSGSVNQQLLKELRKSWANLADAKKSLDKEEVLRVLMPYFEGISIKDALSTSVELIALELGEKLNTGKALLSGGGARNTYLVDRIKHYSKAEIKLPDKEIIDFKEAVIFALLGYLRIREQRPKGYDFCLGNLSIT